MGQCLGYGRLCNPVDTCYGYHIPYHHVTKQKKVSDEKTRFFINTAHDIRTPLTLIKAPLEEVVENRMVAEQALPHMNMALKNVNTLLQLTTNLINFERIDVYSSTLYVSEYELNTL